MDTLLNQQQPLIMGVLNVTPDSFSDGGRYTSKDLLVSRIQSMVNDGADIIDIGGESTRPGSVSVTEQMELDRVLPAIELVQSLTDLPISVDTSKPGVMRQVLMRNVAMVNDINALQDPQALALVSSSCAYVCLMHKQGQPQTMQQSPAYYDVVSEVASFLKHRVDVCLQAGIATGRIVLDPGFGFGKQLQHNLALFKSLSELKKLGYPLLIGVSRKSMLGQILDDLPVDQRLLPSVIAAILAVEQGVKIVRVHDVKETRQAFTLLGALTRKLNRV
ncbi:dihydropteroate synthase [Thiomicrospira sp. R3]|uniref:dihydropteroate synthase n=1 Tax=Thiomicrospira sp. R3 TaxID=3035472 RepID=UPI00259B6DD8|nr:dihydropteroate synthase [Thiomicrospira sp. R3]WFE68069.1 dihydropteroate synthase [Thiomicrospira sp. R3]